MSLCVAASLVTESGMSVSFDGKSVAFDLGENRRGPYVRISEVKYFCRVFRHSQSELNWFAGISDAISF